MLYRHRSRGGNRRLWEPPGRGGRARRSRTESEWRSRDNARHGLQEHPARLMLMGQEALMNGRYLIDVRLMHRLEMGVGGQYRRIDSGRVRNVWQRCRWRRWTSEDQP